jgi:ribonuclease HII
MKLIAGVDEVGCGALVGDVVSAAVILNPSIIIPGLGDSKKISNKNRLILFDEIKNKAKAWSIGRSTSKEIDYLNILNASLLSMKRAVDNLILKPNFVFIDGKYSINISIPSVSVIHGDNLISEISAASILAKVTRDKDMLELDSLFPQYGFAQHKGYPTKRHISMLIKYGPISQHRHTFSPIIKIKNNVQ